MYRVLMPIDTEGKRVLAQAQAVSALPTAAEAVEVTLLYVFDDEAQAEETSVRELPTGERAVEYLTGDRPVAEIETEGRWGDVAEEILDAARSHDIDVIVLGGRKRSPMGSLLFGSVSMDVLLNAERPVMITGEHLEDEREDTLRGSDQNEPLETPGRSESGPENPPDFQ